MSKRSMYNMSERSFIHPAKYGNLSRMKQCIKQGVNVEACLEDGRWAIHLASYYGHLHTVVMYLEQYCRVDTTKKHQRVDRVGSYIYYFTSRACCSKRLCV